MNITKKDEIPIQDSNRLKLFIFDREGALIKETRIDSEYSFGNFGFFPLKNGNYLQTIGREGQGPGEFADTYERLLFI